MGARLWVHLCQGASLESEHTSPRKGPFMLRKLPGELLYSHYSPTLMPFL